MSATEVHATATRRRRHSGHRRRAGGPPGDRTADAHRLLWRAGFGPRPGDVARFAQLSRRDAVIALTRPQGAARLVGPAPHLSDGTPLAPADRDGHDHLSWLDRMVRSDQPLVERMTLIFHDWFANSNDKVDQQSLMLTQNALIRQHALGSFADLFAAITTDPAMLIFLDSVNNQAGDVNENYAREMMELFSLGAGRGAYTERDIREQARALTGWTNDYADGRGNFNFRYDDSRHDSGPKTVFGQTGNWGWQDAVRLCLQHRLHPSFFVTKLWSYFIPTTPSAATIAQLAGTYTRSRYGIRPVVEAILLHQDFYAGPSLVKPPVVFNAGMLRALGRGIDIDDWVGYGDQMGQRLFHPPNVSGWPKGRWLDTSTFKGRWDCATAALTPFTIDPHGTLRKRKRPETAADALASARRFLADPQLSDAGAALLLRYAKTCCGTEAQSHQPPLRAMRTNSLHQLILSSPDYQVC
jgi:uncharacterized protein (DUF1800 family)